MPDLSQTAIAASKLIDTLEEELPDEAVAGPVMVLIEARFPATDDEPEASSVYYRCSESSGIYKLGMLTAAQESAAHGWHEEDE